MLQATPLISTLQLTENPRSKFRDILVAEEAEQSAFNNILIDNLSKTLGQAVERVSLHSLSNAMIKPKSTIISSIDLTRPVMSTLTAEEMVQVKLMTDNVLNLVWLTGGNSFEGERPDFSLDTWSVSCTYAGVAVPSILHFGFGVSQTKRGRYENVSKLVPQGQESETVDFEFELRKEILQVSRMVPEEHMNRIFREKQAQISRLIRLNDAMLALLTIGTVGQFGTLSFTEEKPDLLQLASGYMRIASGGVKCYWGSGSTIVLFVIAGIVFIILAIQQTHVLGTTEERRIFPLVFLKSKEMAILFIEIACSGTVTFVPIFFVPLFYELPRDDSALQASLRLLPFILLLVTMNIVSGFGMDRYGYYMPWFTGGSILVIIVSPLLYTID